MTHLLSIMVLLLKIRATKSCRGGLGPWRGPWDPQRHGPGRSMQGRALGRVGSRGPDHFSHHPLQASPSRRRSCMPWCLCAATWTSSTPSCPCERRSPARVAGGWGGGGGRWRHSGRCYCRHWPGLRTCIVACSSLPLEKSVPAERNSGGAAPPGCCFICFLPSSPLRRPGLPRPPRAPPPPPPAGTTLS